MKKLRSAMLPQKHLYLSLHNTLNRPVHEKLLILGKASPICFIGMVYKYMVYFYSFLS